MDDFENMCTCKYFISVLLTRREVLTSVAFFFVFSDKNHLMKTTAERK